MPKLPNTLVVLPYDPNWITEFERIRVYLMEQIGDLAIEIKHVGSTSVPGLCAKPIIDIVAIMESEPPCADGAVHGQQRHTHIDVYKLRFRQRAEVRHSS